MTDNEIKKALECAIRNDCDCNCVFLLPNKVQDVLDLINRLQAENERLSRITRTMVGEIKAEAYTEFAEELKMALYYEFDELIPSIVADKIDNLLKEKIGE